MVLNENRGVTLLNRVLQFVVEKIRRFHTVLREQSFTQLSFRYVHSLIMCQSFAPSITTSLKHLYFSFPLRHSDHNRIKPTNTSPPSTFRLPYSLFTARNRPWGIIMALICHKKT